MTSSINTYNTLDEKVKLKRSQNIKNSISSNLYAALMMTKEDSSKRESEKNSRVKDLLISDDKEQLSESDKEKLWYTLDYLRIRWISNDIFTKFTSEDFNKIKNHTTASNRTEELIQLIIEKASENLTIADKDKSEFGRDINEHVNAMMRWRNAEIGNNIAEDISLTVYTTKRTRFYWKKIQNIIDKNTDSTGKINWEKCYMSVIKYANYATLPPRKRASTRYIVPMKFGWRNTNKQVSNTLQALKKKSEESTDKKEQFAINSIIKNLQLAFNYYKEKTGVDNASFDDVRISNEDLIYRNVA